MAIHDIPKFERMNPSISVNIVYRHGERASFAPLYCSKYQQRQHAVTLLLLEEDGKFHYTLVRSLSRLLGSQERSKNKKYVCPFCLQCFWREDQQNDHTTYCGLQKPAKIVFPRKPNKSSMDKEERESGEIETVEDLVGITDADTEFFTTSDTDPEIVSFKNFAKTMKTEFVLYVDFECFIKKSTNRA